MAHTAAPLWCQKAGLLKAGLVASLPNPNLKLNPNLNPNPNPNPNPNRSQDSAFAYYVSRDLDPHHVSLEAFLAFAHEGELLDELSSGRSAAAYEKVWPA